MTDPRPPAILVLAQGQADCVSESSKIRIRRALAYVEQFWKVAPIGCHGRERPKLIFAAGIGRKRTRSVLTLAERMAYFAAGERDRMGLPETSYDTICNSTDPTIWSTKKEVKWGFEHANADGTPRFVIVTNETHGKRALCYASGFEIEGSELLTSDDDPPSPLHEFLSSLKPTLASIFGEERLQSLRRKYYWGG